MLTADVRSSILYIYASNNWGNVTFPQADKMLQRAGVFAPAYRDVRQAKGASGAHFSACPAGLFFISRSFVASFDNISDIAGSLFRAAVL